MCELLSEVAAGVSYLLVNFDLFPRSRFSLQANELAALVGKLPLDEAIDVDGATAVDVETSELARLLSRVMASGAEKQEVG